MNYFKRAALMVAVSAALVLSVSRFPITASAMQNPEPEIVKGNVPVTFLPNSEITFGSDGNFEITNIENPSELPSVQGREIGGFLAGEDLEALEKDIQELQEKMDSLPEYPYEEYYIAKEGAAALYGDDGALIRVRGDYEYHSTLDQYLVDGSLPSGRYVGTYGTFSRIVDD